MVVTDWQTTMTDDEKSPKVAPPGGWRVPVSLEGRWEPLGVLKDRLLWRRQITRTTTPHDPEVALLIHRAMVERMSRRGKPTSMRQIGLLLGERHWSEYVAGRRTPRESKVVAWVDAAMHFGAQLAVDNDSGRLLTIAAGNSPST